MAKQFAYEGLCAFHNYKYIHITLSCHGPYSDTQTRHKYKYITDLDIWIDIII